MSFYEKVQEIVARDTRYKADAYEFVMQALVFTQKKYKSGGPSGPRHLTGKELLEGIRTYALDQFGPMTVAVFEHWGIRCTDDIGTIVFTMVERGLMSKTDTDSPDDFKDVYKFRDAFDVFKLSKRNTACAGRPPRVKGKKNKI